MDRRAAATAPATTREPRTADDDLVQRQARALGDPTRYEIFRYLGAAGTDVGVRELTEGGQVGRRLGPEALGQWDGCRFAHLVTLR